MQPDVPTHFTENEVYSTKVVQSNALFNLVPVAKPQGVVTSVYHSKKPHTMGVDIEHTEPFPGGEREKNSGEGRTRGSERPHGGATQVVL